MTGAAAARPDGHDADPGVVIIEDHDLLADSLAYALAASGYEEIVTETIPMMSEKRAP